MTGIVLCGGESTRMGSDKGLLKKGDLSWAEIAAANLLSLKIPFVVSVNKQQFELYSKLFHKTEMVTDREENLLRGPLLGLLSVHEKLPTEDLFVMACDMIDMKQEILGQLILQHSRQTHEAYVFSTGEKYQPLCAIYTADALSKINLLHQTRALKKNSMMHVMEILQTLIVPVKEEDIACFNNYNSL